MAKVDITRIPQNMKQTALWCCWRYQVRAGDDKPTKVPYNPTTGKGARSNDRTTFGTFGQARMAMEMNGYDGLGVGVFDDLCVIDLDHCIEDGVFSDLSTEIFQLMNTYSEISPGGDGVHIYFRAPGLQYDKEKYYIKNPKNGVEIYVAGSTNRFITVTGNALTAAGINDRSKELKKVLDKFMCREVPQKPTKSPVSGPMAPKIRLSMEDDKIIAAAKRARNGDLFKRLFSGNTEGYRSKSEADLALCNILAFWCSNNPEQIDRIFRSSGLCSPKWDEMRGIATYGNITIQKAIARVGKTYSDFFTERMERRKKALAGKTPWGGGVSVKKT